MFFKVISSNLILSTLLYIPNISEANSVKLKKFIIPSAFSRALEQGMSVPVYIRFEGTEEKSKQKIADATLSITDGNITIRSLTLVDLPNSAKLSDKNRIAIENVHDMKFRDDSFLIITSDTRLHFDVSSFHLEMIVSRNALTEKISARRSYLGPSDSESISNILNYNYGAYYNAYKYGDSAHGYLNVDDTISLREHHINLNGSLYGVAGSDRGGELYSIIYERDREGRRFALGEFNAWNIQSLASINAINGGKIYGFSYGNKANSVIEKNSLSLTPVTVFLPAAGEVHIYRDGRLLSVQNFNMGSYEIDTSNFPYGVYDITIDIVVNGKMLTKQLNRVNKIFNHRFIGSSLLYWELFGGSLNYKKARYNKNSYQYLGSENTMISGGAAYTNIPLLSGLNIKTTLYYFDANKVNETDATLAFNEFVSMGGQTLKASDSSCRNEYNVNISLPGGYGALWLSREKSHVNNRIFIQESDNYSIGSTINLSQFIARGGTLTMSQTKDINFGNKYRNIDFSTFIYSGKHVNLGLRAGIQRHSYSDRNYYGRQDHYLSLDLSLPLSTWVDVGVSGDRHGNTLGNINARKQYDDGAIKSIGVSTTTSLNGERYYANNHYLKGNLSYSSKYNAGTISATHSGNNSNSVNISSQGALAWNGKNFGMATDRQLSGVIINTDISNDSKLAAKINNRTYRLSGKSNFIALPAYSKYNLEILNDKNSEDSFDIISGRRQEITLYPGNVGIVNPKVNNMVTVFGRILYPNGQVASNIDIHNYTGTTQTDLNGGFSIDIDKRNPVITLISNDGHTCEADLDLEKSRGAEWVGDVKCLTQTVMSSR